jgi:uncharacterized protein YkwD
LATYGAPLRRHRVITHLVVAGTALAVAVGVAIPTAPVIQAGLMTAPRQATILPANIGIGVPATEPVLIQFPGPMDRDAVANALGLAPRTDVTIRWNPDASAMTLVPTARWSADERYVVYVPAGTPLADGSVLSVDWRASFTTQTAPTVTRLAVTGVEGVTGSEVPVLQQDVMASVSGDDSGASSAAGDMSSDASSATRIGLTFNAAMDRATTEAAFRITPEATGTFQWDGTTLWFVPDGRLTPGTRYTVAVVGARDVDGIPIGGDTSLSFTTRDSAHALHVDPAIGAQGVDAATGVRIVFTMPMDTPDTAAAFRLVDTATGGQVSGTIAWADDATTMTFQPAARLADGRTYEISLGAGARDEDGNAVTASWRFTTTAPAIYAGGGGGGVPAAPGSSSDQQYALNQINAARASYGLAPLVLDAAISAVAYAHAADMMANNYFSHTSLDGTTYKQRLTNGGISYGYSGENQCWLSGGGGVQPTLDWCHAAFWSEPYPGGGNHKDNILNPNFRRVGVGIAVGGSKVIVVWDFTD